MVYEIRWTSTKLSLATRVLRSITFCDTLLEISKLTPSFNHKRIFFIKKSIYVTRLIVIISLPNYLSANTKQI